MKKLIISFCVMLTFLVSTSFAFASYTDLYDSASYHATTSDYGYAYLFGRRDDSTDRISNVSTKEVKYGKVTIPSHVVSRPNNYTCTSVAKFALNGVVKQTSLLSL